MHSERAKQAATASAFESMRQVAITGAVVVIAFFGALGGWAAVAPLESAAIATGELSVESNRKTIQHLEGGIVAQIRVTEGDRVERGQLLVRLDPTRAKATLEQLRTRQQAALALEARLVAERDGRDEIDFPQVLLDDRGNESVKEAIDGEISIFRARQRSMAGQVAILNQRIAQYEKEIEGLQGQISAESTQIKLIRRESTSQQRLVEKKLSGMQRLIELKRDEAEVVGSRSRNVAQIARARQNIAEERLKVEDLRTGRINEVVSALRETQTLLSDTSEQINAAADVLARTEIRAPLDGTVVDLKVHTVGGVIGPGEPLMDVVPEDERLIIRAQVQPNDIDSVHPGLTAQVVLTAFNRRNAPVVEGRVVSVSADRLTDQRTGLPYFLARVELLEESLLEHGDLGLYPGMQTEVMIVTGEQTALDYILRPAIRSFDRAMRED